MRDIHSKNDKCIMNHQTRMDNCPACQVLKHKDNNPFCRKPEWCLENEKCYSIVKYDRACND